MIESWSHSWDNKPSKINKDKYEILRRQTLMKKKGFEEKKDVDPKASFKSPLPFGKRFSYSTALNITARIAFAV